mgnify:FL=1
MEMASISEMLKTLIEEYQFNISTLSKYLELSEEQIDSVKKGNIECLPQDNSIRSKVFIKIGFLYFGVAEDKDMKLSAFLDVLITYHNISKQTIAKMAEVEISDIESMLSNHSGEVAIEAKYRIAVTVMQFRFFLKECEPPIQ